MHYNITILNVNNNKAWKEYFQEWQSVRNRLIKLRHSKRLAVVDIEADTTDDEQDLWRIYNYGY